MPRAFIKLSSGRGGGGGAFIKAGVLIRVFTVCIMSPIQFKAMSVWECSTRRPVHSNSQSLEFPMFLSHFAALACHKMWKKHGKRQALRVSPASHLLHEYAVTSHSFFTTNIVYCSYWMSNQHDLLSNNELLHATHLSDILSCHPTGVSDISESDRTMSDGWWQNKSLQYIVE